MNPPEKIDIFGVKFSSVCLESASSFLTDYKATNPGYVCFPATGCFKMAHNVPEFKKILNQSLLTVADGKITEYYANIKGYKELKNVSGYWLMHNLLQSELTHFFYGCDIETLNKLKKNLYINYPNANILGFKAPPFIELSNIKNNKQIEKDIYYINSLKPDLIWVGISAPKQEYLMCYYIEYIDKGIMLGVGAVFLYHAGLLKKGPEIFKMLGLRWLIRLIY